MLADIDFDIVCHLGHVRNVAISTRGVYFIKVTLLFGKVPQIVAPTTLSQTKTPSTSILMAPIGGGPSDGNNLKGTIKIAPVGVFSAPTSINSTVKGLSIPAAPIISLCHVDEHSRSFCSRSFVVRYKDEEHELNDGVHWRITMPDVDLSELGPNAPACLDLLHINFKLLGIQLVNDPTVDMMRDVHKLLPAASEDVGMDITALDFKLVSEQTLTVQRTSSGLHELYPLRFDRLNFLDVDCMIHCAVTGVWYKNISLNTKGVKKAGKKGAARKRADDAAEAARTASDEASPVSSISSDYTMLNDHFSNDPPSSSGSQKLHGLRKPESTNLVVVPEKGSALRTMKSMASRRGSALWHDKRREDDKEKTKSRIALPMAPSRFNTADSAQEDLFEDAEPEPLPTPEEAGELALDEAGEAGEPLPLPPSDPSAGAAAAPPRARSKARCGVLREEIERVAALCTGPVVANYKTLIGGTENVLRIYQSSISRGSNESVSELRCEVEDVASIVDRMMDMAVSADAEGVLYDAIKACNTQLTARWSQLFSALPRIMPSLRESMQGQYKERVRLFWKRQMLVHTIGGATVESIADAEERHLDLLEVLEEQVRGECGLLTSGPASLSVLARGMPVFDYHVQLQPMKLPFVALQQYTTEEHIAYGLLFSDESGVHASSLDGTVTERAVRGGRLLNCSDDVVSTDLGDIIDLSSVRHKHLSHSSSVSSSLGTAAHATTVEEVEEEEEEVVRQIGPSLRTGASVAEIATDSRGLRTRSIKYGQQHFIRTSGVLAPDMFVEGGTPPHLIVLQHGFQGCSYDMSLLVNHISIELPAMCTYVLAARSNEKKNEDSIVEMGKRLAAEVVTYARDKCPSLLRAGGGRISFVGHSMGSLVVRRALQESVMKQLLPNMHTFLSLSSPHLGTLHAESQLVATGLWALLKWKKCPGLQELVLEDGRGGDIRKSVIYDLAGNGALRHFKHVILVSSPKDQYVPSYSARVQSSSRVEQDSRNGPALKEMTQKLLSQVSPDRLVRLTVGNNVGDGIDINSLIGRKAHLCFLENSVAVSQLVHNLYSYFV